MSTAQFDEGRLMQVLVAPIVSEKATQAAVRHGLTGVHDMGVSQVVAQVVPTAVVPLGAYIDGTNMVFDLDILSKKS